MLRGHDTEEAPRNFLTKACLRKTEWSELQVPSGEGEVDATTKADKLGICRTVRKYVSHWL
jgi:hypothetical protein